MRMKFGWTYSMTGAETVTAEAIVSATNTLVVESIGAPTPATVTTAGIDTVAPLDVSTTTTSRETVEPMVEGVVVLPADRLGLPTRETEETVDGAVALPDRTSAAPIPVAVSRVTVTKETADWNPGVPIDVAVSTAAGTTVAPATAAAPKVVFVAIEAAPTVTPEDACTDGAGTVEDVATVETLGPAAVETTAVPTPEEVATTTDTTVDDVLATGPVIVDVVATGLATIV
jgi:hypothetical protein